MIEATDIVVQATHQHFVPGIGQIDSYHALAACFGYSALLLQPPGMVSSSQTIRRISSGAQDAFWPLRLRWDPPPNQERGKSFPLFALEESPKNVSSHCM